jgi:subtilisin family serine protease
MPASLLAASGRRLHPRFPWRQNLPVAKFGTIAVMLVLALPVPAGARQAPGSSELSATLSEVTAEREQSTARAAIELAKERGVDVRGDDLLVLVKGSVQDVPEIEASLKGLGAEVHLNLRGVIQARLPVAQLEAAAAAPGVQHVREARRMQPLAVAGEGPATTNAASWHAAGMSGAGVKVGIIDAFFGYQASQARGDLPASVVPVDFCPSLGGFPGGNDDHGTAVSEIVHEMAPGAQLYLLCVGTEVEFAEAALYAIENGISIVNCSCAFFNVGRGDGTGTDFSNHPAAHVDFPDLAVEAARTGNVLPVIAAGNSRQQHWSGVFADLDANGTNNFAGADESINVPVVNPGLHCFYLKWDDWPRSTQNFDLYAYRDPSQAPIAVSSNPQNGAPGQTPTEEFCPVVSTPGVVHLVIRRVSGTAAPRFDLFSDNADLGEHVTPGSLTQPADSPFALAAGAFCWQSGALEDFSSVGPTIDGRIKPDLVAPNNVSTGVYGPFPGCAALTGFAGTSASAPHAAGAAALVKQAFPGFNADQLQSFLEARAVDAAPAGKDNLTGAGLLNVGAVPTSQPGGAGQSGPPPAKSTPAALRKALALGRARKALKRRYGRRYTRSSRRKLTCKRSSRIRYRCSYRFTYKRKRYRGIVLVTRRADGSVATSVRKR